MPDIEEFLVRPTPEDQKKFIEERILGQEEDDTADEEVAEEFSDDIPM